MKHHIFASLLLGGLMLTSCSDFFEPQTSDALDGDSYMSSLTEMATGYLGVMTKMQAIGDKEIFLTDTRGEMLEPTEQSTAELIALYNYEDDLTGNSYADPAGYYDLVIACNDYLAKLFEFNAKHPELVKETDFFPGLVASTLRMKAWVYLTLGEIYGQALWFDDPITSIKDVNDKSIFTMLSLPELIDRCVMLLENGYQGMSAKDEFSWVAWIDATNYPANINNSDFRYWDQMTPPYDALLSRLRLWRAALREKAGNTVGANDDYAFVANTLLRLLNEEWMGYSRGNIQWGGNILYWKLGDRAAGVYGAGWNFKDKKPNPEMSVSAILYDYSRSQTNRLLYHFSDEYPNKYLLRSSEAGRLNFTTDVLAPLGNSVEDGRFNTTTRQHGGKNWYISKFRPVGSTIRVNPYEDDVHIYTFRATELHLWLCEALNHLGRYDAMARVINGSFTATSDNDWLTGVWENDPDKATAEQMQEFEGFSPYWVNTPGASAKTGSYHTGIRGCMKVGAADVWTKAKVGKTVAGVVVTEAMVQRHNDEILANEWMLEASCEGKVYPSLVRFAERYSDATIVSKRVTPKYDLNPIATVTSAAVAGKIEGTNAAGLPGYFVPWKL